jgi:hypothetical protein
MSRPVTVGEVVQDHFPLFDLDNPILKKSGETGFTAYLWKDNVASGVPVTVAEIGASGEYGVSFTPDAEGVWSVQVLADYDQSWWGEEYVAATGGTQDIVDMLRRLLGLSHENIFIDETNYDADTQLISARVRLFDSKTNCDAATDGGSETTGLVATYQLTTTWEGLNQFAVFKQTLEP